MAEQTKTSLHTFVKEEEQRLWYFELWYEAMHELNPVEFPLSFPEEDAGLWDEAFTGYSVGDEVYKIEET